MIKKQPFGRTDHLSARAIFGASALGSIAQARADRIVEMLLYYGVNHIDTSPTYEDSELRIGPWMDRHRKNFFLATKTDERTYQKAREQFHCSLERLRVDYVDLLQLQNLMDPEEWEVAMGPGGALEAVIEAREQGLTRFIGVTGHSVVAPAMHKRSLERFDFDSVLLPYNYVGMQNPQYAVNFKDLLTLCQERNVAVQTVKSIARGRWGNKTRTRTTWYEPLENQAAIDKAVHWVLGRPDIFLDTVGDIHLLPRVLDAASYFEVAPSEEEMKELVVNQKMMPLFG